MPAVQRRWSRRQALGALALASTGLLTGCRVRLENDAPRIPLLPVRTPMADEPVLLAALPVAMALAASCAELAGVTLRGAVRGIPARLAAVHLRQAAVLRQVLDEGGVPIPAMTPSTTTTPGAPGGNVGGVAALAVAEREAVSPSALAALAGVSVTHLALLLALTAQRAAAATLLGAPPRWDPPTGPTSQAVVPQLAATRAAVYAFQVVAAQSDKPTRPLALRTLGALQARAAVQEVRAGSAAGPPPLGYRLPFPVDDPRAARRLAGVVLGRLMLESAGAALPLAGDQAALTSTVRWLAETQLLAIQWGGRLAAFPGLAGG